MISNKQPLRVILLTNIDGENVELEFDYITSYSSNTSNTLSNKPTLEYDKPSNRSSKGLETVNVSGIFSLQGNKHGYSYTNNKYGRLKNIQLLFNRIMNESIICDIVKTEDSGNSHTFMEHKNMILKSVEWSENENNLGFSFAFTCKGKYVPITITDYSDIETYNNTELSYEEEARKSLLSSYFNINSMINYYLNYLMDKGLTNRDFLYYYGYQINQYSFKDYNVNLGKAVRKFVETSTKGKFSYDTSYLNQISNILYATSNVDISDENIHTFSLKDKNGNLKTVSETAKSIIYFNKVIGTVYNSLEKIQTGTTFYTFTSYLNQTVQIDVSGVSLTFRFYKNYSGGYTLTRNDYLVVNNIESLAATTIERCSDENVVYENNSGQRIYLIRLNSFIPFINSSEEASSTIPIQKIGTTVVSEGDAKYNIKQDRIITERDTIETLDQTTHRIYGFLLSEVDIGGIMKDINSIFSEVSYV